MILENSLLRNVEVFGAGFSHNETVDVAAVLSVRRTPMFDAVNITNSSMHALQVYTILLCISLIY